MTIGTGENILKPFKTQEVLDLEAKLKVAVEALEFMKQGCLVPPDGGSPDIPDYINCATEALKKIKGV